MSALSHKQKASLAQLANRAWMQQCALARGRGETPDNCYKAAGEFRRAEVVKACGKLGLCCCSQEDYKTVEAHFYHLLGDDGRAFKALVREGGNERRQWEYKILKMLAAMGKPNGLPYAAGICRQMFHGLDILDASIEQLRKIFYALKYQHERNQRKKAA